MSLPESQVVSGPPLTESSIARRRSKGLIPVVHMKTIGQGIIADLMIQPSAHIPDILILRNDGNECPQFDGR
jgi:hypothetical protein